MPDAVVIGSGPNGLAAAIRIAEAGRSVAVLEAADTPGGAVKTEELTLPGFLHDTFSSVYPAGAASPVFARMPLARHGLEWIHPEACYAHPLPDGTAPALFRDVGATAAALNLAHSGDGDRWAAFVQPYVDRSKALQRTMLTGFPPLRGPLELLLRGGPALLARFTRLLPGSSEAFGRRLFDGDGPRAWLHGSAQHSDASPDSPGSAIVAFYLNVLGHAFGWPSPRGGAGSITTALVNHLS